MCCLQARAVPLVSDLENIVSPVTTNMNFLGGSGIVLPVIMVAIIVVVPYLVAGESVIDNSSSSLFSASYVEIHRSSPCVAWSVSCVRLPP